MARKKGSLPKWAQTRIRVLEKEIQDAKDRLAEVLREKASPHPGPPVILDPNLEPMPLPTGSTVAFHFGPLEERRSVHVRSAEDLRGPYVLAMGSGDGLLIEPRASNRCYIRPWIRKR